MKLASSPLFLDDSHLSESSNKIRRGSTTKRNLKLKNIGDRKAEVDIWIVATNKKSDPVLRWCTFSEKSPLSIGAKESQDVTLNFQIPPSAIPDLYHYEIIVEAAAQYPGKIFRRPQQLQVLSSDRDAELSNEPEYSIQPITNSTNPLPLKAGEQLELKVKVENRSKRVDSFYLNCPELQQEWYTVHYPESELDIPGLVEEIDGLELNPGTAGEITLILHPPQYTPAGNYFPTINLISSNREDLVNLDVVYLQILPDDRLNVEMLPLSQKLPQEVGEFELELTNQGNIQREISIRAKDEEEIFAYHLQPSAVQLSPGEKQRAILKVKPKKWWCRHWRGKGLKSIFDITLENTIPEKPLLPVPTLPKNLPQGTVVWQSRPWWQLLLILLVLGTTIGAVGFTIWLKYFNKPIPKATEFEPIAKEYQEAKDKGIGLKWQISNPQQVKKVTLIRLQGDRETDRKNYLFPEKISNKFKLGNGTCQLIDTNSSSEGKGDKQGVSSLLSGMLLDAMGMNTQFNKSQDVVECQASIPNNQKAGHYTFKIEIFAKQDPEQPSSSQTTDTITIKPPIRPKITNFSSTKPSYQEVGATSPLPKASQLSGDRRAPNPIRLNWEISHPRQIQKLKIVGLAPDGSINSVEKHYVIHNNNLPAKLREFCIITATSLRCQNVPTDASKVGNYTFRLTLFPVEGYGDPETRNTANIKILAKPAKPVNILAFTVDGKNVTDNPKRIYEIDKGKKPGDISVAWEVEDDEDIKVELLPFGEMNKPKGSISYALSYPPSSQNLTLRVTNKDSEQKTQSILIETAELNQSTQTESQSSGRTSNQSEPKTNSSPTTSPRFSKSQRRLIELLRKRN